MESVFEGPVVLIVNLNLKLLGLQIFNSEGSNHELLLKSLDSVLILDIVV